MKNQKSKNKSAGNEWVEGSVQDFLGLSAADMEFIETKLAASRLLKATRQLHKLTQQAVAAKLGTSQSRLAKMESGDPSVSLDLLFKSLFSLGVNRRKIADTLSTSMATKGRRVTGKPVTLRNRAQATPSVR